MKNKKTVIMVFIMIILFACITTIFLYENKENYNITKSPSKNYNPQTSEYSKKYSQFVIDLPCGITDFDSPYVKPVQCDEIKMQKGENIAIKFHGRIINEQGNGIEGIKIIVNNGEAFYTDKQGFYSSTISVDSNKNSINFTADKQGYSPIRKIYNAADSIKGNMKSNQQKEYFAEDIQMRNIDIQKVLLSSDKNIIIQSKKYPGVSATIPANGLVNSENQVVTGEIVGEITYLDPEKPEDVKIMPGFDGNMIGIDRYGRQVTIQSGGMVFFHFKEKGSDEILQPKKGITITITQPLTDNRENYYQGLLDSPSQINKNGQFKTNVTIIKKDGSKVQIAENSRTSFDYWYFNKRTGLWEEWPSQEYIIDLKNKLFILKIERLY